MAVNYIAVLIASVVTMIFGFAWYSKMLFADAWMKAAGIDKKKAAKNQKQGMAGTMLLAFAGALVTNYVFAMFIEYTKANTFVQGSIVGFWVWLGFFATTMMGVVLWEGKPWNLYLINSSHYLVVLLINGGILALM